MKSTPVKENSETFCTLTGGGSGSAYGLSLHLLLTIQMHNSFFTGKIKRDYHCVGFKRYGPCGSSYQRRYLGSEATGGDRL